MSTPKKQDGPDLQLLRALADLMTETSLTEIEYDCGDWSIRVARGAVVSGLGPAAGLNPGSGELSRGGADAPPVPHPGLLTSPMVGVIYTSPEPDTPPFIRVGDPVSVGDTIFLIEAMKVFNPISAHRAGRVTRIFVSNGVPVEFGEPLVIIE